MSYRDRIRQLTKTLRCAIAIIRNDCSSPRFDDYPEYSVTRNRWCDEMLQEAGIVEFPDVPAKEDR